MRESDLKISISGIRGIVGRSLSPRLLIKFSEAFSSYVGGGRIAVASDTRPSRDMVRWAVFSGLLSCGARPIDLGILPIPSLQVYTKEKKLDGAVSITASHNPIEWNALKLIRKGGVFLSPNEAGELLDYYYQGRFNRTARPQGIQTDEGAFDPHEQKILKFIDTTLIRKRRPRVVVDPCGGAAAPFVGAFLEKLGAEVFCIHGSIENGFPRNPEPVPSNLEALCRAVREHGADIGLAQDADADRLAAVDEKGTPIGEEYTLALAVEYFLKNKKRTPIVVNLSTSQVMDDIAERENVLLHRTRVGEINVARMMRDVRSEIGGEGNGGIIAAPVHYCRDSFSGMALLLEYLAWSGKPLSTLKGELPPYFMVKDKIRASFQEGKRFLKRLEESFDRGRTDRMDGLRVEYPDFWFHVRPSNTEPVIRLQVEAGERTLAEKTMRRIKQLLIF
ncbi:MAG: phosphoglucosamine mutase [Acidobacteria bacterium]|nr:phosphoglucosamine mutase [Acidobacteriota bacterium]MBU1473966.1 phosphoglucosamine mutase [Acidobacteriota bacterium]MBU2438581.1 phosphoglucosamine mutase [Acidobacteriota bacterium]